MFKVLVLPLCLHGPETLAARGALEVLLLRVPAHVRLHVVGVAGPVSTHLARVRKLAVVLRLVAAQRSARRVVLVTLAAVERGPVRDSPDLSRRQQNDL